MGSFSWYASDTGRAIQIHRPVRVYALQPDGEPLKESAYDGCGEFAGQDIYDLVADWNRMFLSEHPDFLLIKDGKQVPVSSFCWYPIYADLKNTREEVTQKVKQLCGNPVFDYRWIGIDIACDNQNNFRIPYPIKIVQYIVPYCDAQPSMRDPYQGGGWKPRYMEQPCE